MSPEETPADPQGPSPETQGAIASALPETSAAPAVDSTPAASFEQLLKLCTRKERRFILEYMVDENGSRAVVRAGCFRNTRPDMKAWKLKQRPRVAAAIAAGIRERDQEATERALVTREEVVRELAHVAFAEAREISEIHIDCCRYCWGRGHRYQETPSEREQRYANYQRQIAEVRAKDDAKPIPEFDDLGGLGFNALRAPNPRCPECFGRGVKQEIFHDTRGLSPAARALYAGVKRTKEGLEVKTHSKERALEMLTRHVGGFAEKHELTGKDGTPLQQPMMVVTREEAAAIDRKLDDEV